jgi:peptidyl-prolyl cis-trans isomerase C
MTRRLQQNIVFILAVAMCVVTLAAAFTAVPTNPSSTPIALPATPAATRPRSCYRGIAKSSTTTTTALSMGLMDALSKAFSNNEYGPPPEAVRATARHILVPTKEEAQVVMKMVTTGESTFADCARDYSTCPSASQGGSLGSFPPGKMVPEFDKVIFSPDTKVGQIVGPVMTNFGYHVIMVEKRTGGGDKY